MKFVYLIDTSKLALGHPSRFHWQIEVRENINQINLRRVAIFNTSYMVNDYNRTCMATVGGNTEMIQLTPGDYTPQSLADELEAAIVNAGLPPVDVSDDETRHKFVFSDPITFDALNYPLFARLIGVNSSEVNGLTPKVYQLKGPTYYQIIIREITGYGDLQRFIIINNQANKQMLSFDSSPISQLNTQIKRLNKFSIEIRDPDNNIIDFNGSDVVLELEIEAER